MSVSVTLPEPLEVFLQSHAKDLGVPLETLLSRTIEERWGAASHATALPDKESSWLLELQTLFPQVQTEEYIALCREGDAGTLTDAGRRRLLSLIEERDLLNARRLEIVGELARLRGVPVRQVIAQLDLTVA